MKVLKGLAFSLLSFLLFLSLSIFGLVLTLNYTILNQDFIICEVNKLDIPSLSRDLLSQQIPQDEPYIADVVDNTLTDLEPWIRDQIGNIVYSSYDYFLGKSQSLSLEISLEPVRDSFKNNLREAIMQSPPPELDGVPPVAVELYINEANQNIDEMIPPSFQFDESSLDTEILAQLEQVRQYIGYVQLAYKALIGFVLLLILGIILMNREIRSATRKLGIVFTTYGALEYAGIFVFKSLTRTQLPQLDITPLLKPWLLQVFNDFLGPLEIFSLSLLISGVALVIISFVYKPRQPVEALY